MFQYTCLAAQIERPVGHHLRHLLLHVLDGGIDEELAKGLQLLRAAERLRVHLRSARPKTHTHTQAHVLALRDQGTPRVEIKLDSVDGHTPVPAEENHHLGNNESTRKKRHVWSTGPSCC